MAGIGFELKKLFRKDGTFPNVGAALKSMLVSAGPWFIAVCSILFIQTTIRPLMVLQEYYNFLSLITYSFIFSMILTSAPINMVIRAASDALYTENIEEMVPLYLSGVLFCGLPSFFLAYFYLSSYTEFGAASIDGAYLFASLSILWVSMVFVSALRAYNIVSFTFLAGMLLSCLLLRFYAQGNFLSSIHSYTTGVVFTIFLLTARFYKEFGPGKGIQFNWLFRKDLIPLAISGLFFFLAVWIDKFLYWIASPHQVELVPGFLFYPNYDIAVFLANISILPTSAYFTVFVETHFQVAQKRFIDSVVEGRDLNKIKEYDKKMVKTYYQCLIYLLAFQAILSGVFFMIVPFTLDLLNQQVDVIPILRITIICAGMQVFFQSLTIFLYYFDFQKEVVILTVVGFFLNLIFTFQWLDAPMEYTGYSMFASLGLTLILSLYICHYKITRARYYTFNASTMI